MNKDLKFLLKRAFDAGTMYEATLSEECSFIEFIKYVENQQLSICDVVGSKRRLEIWDNGYKQGYEDGKQGKQKHKDLGVY